MQYSSLSRNGKIASISEFIFGLCVGIYSIALNFHLTAKGFGNAEIGVLLSSGFIVTAITSFFAGKLGDWKGFPFVMTLGTLLMAVSLVITSFASVHFLFYIGQIIYSMGIACVMAMEFALATSQVEEDQKQFVYNFVLIMYFLGSIFGSFICGNLAEKYLKTQNPYFLMLLLCAVLYLILGFIRSRLPRQRTAVTKRSGIGETIKDKKVISFLLFGFVTMFVFSTATSMLNLVLRNRYYLSDADIGTVFSISSILGCIALVLLPSLVKKFSSFKISTVTMAVQLVAVSAMAVSGVQLFCLMAFVRTVTGNVLYSTVDSPMLRSVDEGNRGTYAGIRVFSNYLGMSAASAIAGYLIAKGKYLLLFIMGGIFVLSQNLIYHLLCARYIKQK